VTPVARTITQTCYFRGVTVATFFTAAVQKYGENECLTEAQSEFCRPDQRLWAPQIPRAANNGEPRSAVNSSDKRSCGKLADVSERASLQNVVTTSATIRMGVAMRILCIGAALALSMTAMTSPAGAKGCIKGAIVGGVAGHYAGHHGAAGAAVGCAVGHHEARKHEREGYNGEQPREH
jgi:hypothetical protein